MAITDMLEHNAKCFPNHIGVVQTNPGLDVRKPKLFKDFGLVHKPSEPLRREITWSDFNDTSNKVANMLISRGIQKGQKVALLLMNCIEWLPIYLGILKSGAVAVPINYRYTPDEIEYCLKKANVCALFFGRYFIGRIERIASRYNSEMMMFYVGNNCPMFAESYISCLDKCSSTKPDVIIDEDDDAAIYFSAGESGALRAILLRHSSLSHSAKAEAIHHALTHDDIFLCIAPLYHAGVKMHWFGSLYTGSKAVLLSNDTPKTILETISKEHCSVVFLLVPWCRNLLDSIDNGSVVLSDYHLNQWRLMHIGAQPVPSSIIRRWNDHFPDMKYDTDYGLTESGGPGCLHLGMDNTDHVETIGKAGYGWQCKIVDEYDCEMFKGCAGELCVKGPGVMKCYYGDPDATSMVLKNGWLHTGDIGIEDLSGFIRLVDRKKDVIISGAENLYPVEIENFIKKNPLVKNVAVIGFPDSTLGEIACAIIQRQEGTFLSESDITSFCRSLPMYKRPRKVIFDEIPINEAGEVDKVSLRKKYGVVRLVESQICS